MNHKPYYPVSIKEIDLEKLENYKTYHAIFHGGEEYESIHSVEYNNRLGFYAENIDCGLISDILLEEDEYKKLVPVEEMPPIDFRLRTNTSSPFVGTFCNKCRQPSCICKSFRSFKDKVEDVKTAEEIYKEHYNAIYDSIMAMQSTNEKDLAEEATKITLKYLTWKQ